MTINHSLSLERVRERVNNNNNKSKGDI